MLVLVKMQSPAPDITYAGGLITADTLLDVWLYILQGLGHPALERLLRTPLGNGLSISGCPVLQASVAVQEVYYVAGLCHCY